MPAKLLVALLLAGSVSARQVVTDPFTPGERWTWTPDAQTPWIPRSVALVGRDEWIWTAPSHQNAGVAFLATSDASATPLEQLFDWTGATGAVEVRTAGPPRGLFALGGFPAVGGRRYELRRYDAEDAAAGNGFAALWIKQFGFRGRVLWDVDESGRVFVVAESATTPTTEIMEVDGVTGATVATTSLAQANLRAFSLSADGGRRAVLAGTTLEVVDAAGSLGTWTTTQVQSSVALDASGERLAFADLGRAQVWLERAVGFQHAFDVLAQAGEVVTNLTWSGDGSTLAVGFWDPSSSDLRVVVHDQGGTQRYEALQRGGMWQNYVADLALDHAGSRLAIGTWGDVGSTEELFLVDLATGGLVLAEDLGGSVDDLALSADGGRVVVCYREAHANQLSTRGSISLFDTAERDLVLTGATRPGGALTASLRLPGPGVGIFLLGHEGPAAWDPFGLGALAVDPAGPLWSFVGDGTAPLRSELTVPVPASTALVGVPWALHAGGVTAAGPFQAAGSLFPRIL